jgi:hypothetical protein
MVPLMGNLRDRAFVADRLWDWAFLNECFRPTPCRPSDVDGEIERNGLFLRLEAKPVGARLSVAQEIVFNRLLKLRRPLNDGTSIRAFTIIVFYGEPSIPEYMQYWPGSIDRCDVAIAREHVRAWWEFATGVTE